MFEAYSVGIRLRLLDSVSTGLVSLAGQFMTLNRHVISSQAQLTQLENKLKQIKTLALFGGVATAVGAGGLALFKAPLEEAKKFQTELARFTSLGFGDKVNSDAQRFARGMATYGTSARDNMTLLSDAMAVFKNLSDAQLAAPIMAKMKFANEAIFGKEGGEANERQFMDMLKVIELRQGLSSPAEFARQANYVQQVISGSRGRVDAAALLQARKTGGVAVSRLSDDAFYLGLEPLIQEFGGFRTGTGLMSIYSNLVQGRASITAQREMMRLGLLDKSKVEFNSIGMLKKALPGAFIGSEVFDQKGPLALLNEVLLPAFKRAGITSDEAILNEFGTLLSNRTASNILSSTFLQRARIAQNWEANRGAQNIDQLNAGAQNTLAGKQINLDAQYANAKLALGEAVLPIALKVVTGLTSIVKGVVAFANEYPRITKTLTVGFGVLSALVLAGGAITLATAGFKALGLALTLGQGAGIGTALMGLARGIGPAVMGITTLTGALGALAGVFGAAGFGFLFGKLLNSLGPGGDLGGYLGGKFADLTHGQRGVNYNGTRVQGVTHITPRWNRPAGDFAQDMQERAGGSPFISQGSPQVNVMVTNKLTKDGLVTLVTDSMGRILNRPQTGPSVFDGSASLAPAGSAF